MSLAKIKTALQGLFKVDSNIADADVTKAFTRTFTVATGAATTTSAHGTATPFAVMNTAHRLKSAYFMNNSTTLAADATNYGKLCLYRRTSDGVTTSLVGYISSASAAVTSLYGRALTLVATNADAAIGQTYWYQWVKGDIVTTGLAVGAGVLTAVFEEID